MDRNYVIGVDVGGTNTEVGVVNKNGNILDRQTIATDRLNKDVMPFVTRLAEAIRQVGEKVGGLENVRGVGIGAPNGNYYSGRIRDAVNLDWEYEGKKDIPIVDLVKEKTGLQAKLTNDANAAAMGEMEYGAARGMKNFIEITLGTGVGSGIVADGKVVYGSDGFAGELGHVIQVRSNGRRCGCGRLGCLEAYASATGVAQTAREILETTDRQTILRDLPWESITSKQISIAAEKGDQVAIDIYNFTGRMLGQALADFVAFNAPEAIILFGGLTRAGDLLMKPVEEAMRGNLLTMWQGKIKKEDGSEVDKVQLLVSALPEADAAILGASALAWEL